MVRAATCSAPRAHAPHRVPRPDRRRYTSGYAPSAVRSCGRREWQDLIKFTYRAFMLTAMASAGLVAAAAAAPAAVAAPALPWSTARKAAPPMTVTTAAGRRGLRCQQRVRRPREREVGM